MDNNDKKRKREDQDVASQKEHVEKVTDGQEIGGETKDASAATETTTTPYASSLQRPDGQGMNPRNILMGIYGSRGEKIKHTVHDGALKLPASCVEILNDIQQECVAQTSQDATTTFELPAIDGVIRPTMDSSLKVIIITELTSTERSPPMSIPPMNNPMHGMQQQQPPLPAAQSKWETHARNWKLKVQQQPNKQADNTSTAERIRGGGDSDVVMGESDDNQAKPEATENVMATSTMHSQPAAAASSETNQEKASTAAAATAAEAFSPPKSVGEAAAAAGGSTDPEAKTSSDTVPPPTAGTTAPDIAAPQDSTSTPSSSAADAKPTSPTPAPPAPSATTTTTTQPTAGAAAESQQVPSTVASASTPTPIVSSSTTTTAPKTKVPAVIPLPAKPRPQWEQQMPGPNDEMQTEPKTPKPSWYSTDSVSDLERQMLPEWFNGSAIHRTLDSYKQTRERIMDISDKLGQRYVTGTLVRRTIPGDAGSLLRLHEFLMTWGFINEEAINDSAPTASGFRAEEQQAGTLYGGRRTNVVWNATSRDELMEAVVDESKKRRRKMEHDDTSFVPIDWAVVSKRVGNGASAADCEKVFLALPLEAAVKTQEERSITPDVTSSEQKDDIAEKTKMDLHEKMLKDIVDEARPEVVKAATDAALVATENVTEAQKAGLLAVVASEAALRAKKEDDTVSRLLAELQEQRLQKLENRLALLDDVEGVLEAERVALELERRDLYTARCRHWFGGAS